MNSRRTLSLGLLILILSGCGRTDPAAEHVASRNATNIQKLANAYILYAELNGANSPKSADELKQYITGYEKIKRNLDMMGISPETFEDCFVSKLDNEEFEVRWGVKFDPDAAAIPIVFEKTGVDGVRRVALSDSRILEVSSKEQYEKLLQGKISKEDAGSVLRTGDGREEGE